MRTMWIMFALVLAAGCAAQGGVAAESDAVTWKVEAAQGGYTVSLPADLIAGYPDGSRVQVVVGDEARGETVVNGVATTLSATRMFVRTDEVLGFTDGAYLNVRNADSCALEDENICPRFGSKWCHGCPWNPTLAYWGPGICYCYDGRPINGY